LTATLQEGRSQHLDGLRGIAALIVVVTHSLSAFQPTAVFGQPAGSVSWLFLRTPFAIFTNGFGAVAVFFLLSGFVLTKKYFCRKPSLGIFAEDLSKRFLRLYCVAFPAALLAVLLMIARLYRNNAAAIVSGSPWLGHLRDAASWRDVMRLLGSPLASLSGDFIVVGWTLWVELWASYVLFIILVSLVALPRKARIQAYALLFVLARIGLGKASQIGWLSYFILGMAIADNESVIKSACDRLSSNVRFLLVFGVLATFVAFACVPSYAWGEGDQLVPAWACRAASIPFVSGPSGLAGVLAFMLVAFWQPAQRAMSLRPMLYLGKISVGLYLVHIPIICAFSSAIAERCSRLPTGQLDRAMWGIALATVAMSIFAGHFYSMVFDQLAIAVSRSTGRYVRARVEAL
jgi:peptidoglycan/LPS O-acetylase OafA/YrhL